jgi:hypothetical protein
VAAAEAVVVVVAVVAASFRADYSVTASFLGMVYVCYPNANNALMNS